tara:strand:- start:310 stop:582 length:273 start_codon:yes stop_codon:yes gene_type:complete
MEQSDIKKRRSKRLDLLYQGYRLILKGSTKFGPLSLTVVAPLDEAVNREWMKNVVQKSIDYLVEEGFLPSEEVAEKRGLKLKVHVCGKED